MPGRKGGDSVHGPGAGGRDLDGSRPGAAQGGRSRDLRSLDRRAVELGAVGQGRPEGHHQPDHPRAPTGRGSSGPGGSTGLARARHPLAADRVEPESVRARDGAGRRRRHRSLGGRLDRGHVPRLRAQSSRRRLPPVPRREDVQRLCARPGDRRGLQAARDHQHERRHLHARRADGHSAADRRALARARSSDLSRRPRSLGEEGRLEGGTG